MAAKPVDMTGNRYAGLVALSMVGRNSSRGYTWLFSCDCGVEFEASGSEVRYGRINSCPACAAEKKRMSFTTHGLADHPLYGTWTAMKSRCLNPNFEAYKDYGGRGITVCSRWSESFADFLADMGERPTPAHTLERNNTNGNYEPNNCRWATRLEQANNKRNNRQISIEGVTKTLAQWALDAGVTEAGLRARIKRGIAGVDLLDPSSLPPLVFNGEQKTLEQWAEKVGIKKGTLSSRIYVYGWTLERALTEGAKS